MLIKIVLSILSVYVFLYLFWQRLKEDYARNQIFTTSFYLLFGMALGYMLARSFAHAWWFWLSLAGSILGIVIGILRFKLRVFETFEAGLLGGLVFLGTVYLYDWVIYIKLSSAVGFVIILALFVLFLILDKHYKRFTWYKSGKVGFTGLSITGIFFLIRTLVALKYPNVLFFAGSYDSLISGTLAFISFLILFNLSRKTA